MRLLSHPVVVGVGVGVGVVVLVKILLIYFMVLEGLEREGEEE